MKFDSFTFVIFIAFSLIAFHLFKGTRARPYVLASINTLFLLSFTTSIIQLVPLLAFLSLGYAFISIIHERPNNSNLAAFILIIVLIFIYLKRYTIIDILPPLGFPYIVVGLSYILFRIIQVLVDMQCNDINERLSPLVYFNFVCFFLNFASGPIQRYQDYRTQELKSANFALSEHFVIEAFSRIANGYIKIVFLAPLFHTKYQDYTYIFQRLPEYYVYYADVFLKIQEKIIWVAGWYAFAVASYTIFLYLNFSGYMDIVIGVGRLYCFDIPENFNRPFSAKNFIDLWSRWHITLSEWFKLYFFNPLLKYLISRWGSPVISPYLGVIVYFITFFLLGAWHGTTMMFFFCGFFLGLGVSFNKLYQVVLRKWIGKRNYRRLTSYNLYKYFSQGFTFSYFCISLTWLWMDLDQLKSLFGTFIIPVWFAVFLVLGTLTVVFIFCWRTIANFAEAVYIKLRPKLETIFILRGWIAVRIILISYIVLRNVNPAPEFVYKAF